MNPNEPGTDNAVDLGESHLRRINSSLVVLDQRLDTIQRWESGAMPSGPLFHWRKDIDPRVIAQIGLEVGKAREGLRRVIAMLGLQPHEMLASREIQTGAIFSIIDLEELEPHYIKAYGALTGTQTQLLQGVWEPLRRPLDEIRRLCITSGVSNADEVGP